MIREQMLAAEKVKALDWREGGLYLLDQRLLPQQELWQRYQTSTDVAQAIAQIACGVVPQLLVLLQLLLWCWRLSSTLLTG